MTQEQEIHGFVVQHPQQFKRLTREACKSVLRHPGDQYDAARELVKEKILTITHGY